MKADIEYYDVAAADHSVDGRGRATALRPLAFASPHTRAFHLAWLNLFTCFFSAFAAAPLLPVLRPALLLAPSDVSAGSVASLCGVLLSRLSMGFACDLLGPRIASASASLLTAAGVALAAALATSPPGFLALRFVAGLSLGNFVSNQYWMSSVFAPATVGLANSVAGGWANSGTAAAQLIMPLAYSLLLHAGVHLSLSWRIAFLLPALLQTITAFAIFFFPENPGSSCHGVKKASKKTLAGVMKDGLGNYRVWLLATTYALCYGVELAMENVVAGYFGEKFGLGMEAAGAAAACFGLMNVVSRPAGGVLSDAAGGRFEMRGRLWALWAVQTAGGALCVVVGMMRSPSLPVTVAAVAAFAASVQAAAGLTFGVVPFVSKRSLGVVSGTTASGGPVGAIVMQLLFFSNATSSSVLETGMSRMGIVIIACTTLAVVPIYFPQWGGMLCGPTGTSMTEDDDDDDDTSGSGAYVASGDYELLR